MLVCNFTCFGLTAIFADNVSIVRWLSQVLQTIKYLYLLSVIVSTGDHQCGFRRNKSTTDHKFCVRQILIKKREYNEAVLLLFIDFKKAYDAVRLEVLYNILIEFGINMKLANLMKMYE